MAALPGQVSYEPGRAFIPLALSGCGVGCRYCYIDRPGEDANALPVSEMKRLLNDFQRHIHASPSTRGTLVAIGCDTEVGVSDRLVENAILCLEFASRHELPVQLSTKFPLPTLLRDAFDSWRPDQPRPVVFTTITTTSLSARIEPRAPSPVERATNFGPRRTSWLSYALIKPFTDATARDAEGLTDLLDKYRPDGAVVGVRYRRRPEPAATPIGEHPFAKGWFGGPPSVDAGQLRQKLVAIGLPVFMNTRCVSAWHNSSRHGEIVKRNHPYLCVDCGACPGTPGRSA
jgi:hypothetical protein